jgi:transcriptional regulator with XRE-family HTH domain
MSRQRRETKQGVTRAELDRCGLLLESIGVAIGDARKDLGVTQTELARRVRVSRFQMSKHESGTAEMPVTRLFEICQALKVKPTDFMRGVVKAMNGGRR